MRPCSTAINTDFPFVVKLQHNHIERETIWLQILNLIRHDNLNKLPQSN